MKIKLFFSALEQESPDEFEKLHSCQWKNIIYTLLNYIAFNFKSLLALSDLTSDLI